MILVKKVVSLIENGDVGKDYGAGFLGRFNIEVTQLPQRIHSAMGMLRGTQPSTSEAIFQNFVSNHDSSNVNT